MAIIVCVHACMYTCHMPVCVTVYTCSLGLIEKLPAVGFIQVIYWQLCISFSTSRCLSYLQRLCLLRLNSVFSLHSTCVPDVGVSLYCTFMQKEILVCIAFVLPVVVVKVLAYECVRLDGPVNIHLWHVEVVYEVDESLCGGRSKLTTSFLLQGFLQDT